MGKRCKGWRAGLAADLRDPVFAREFLLASIDQGMPLQAAIRRIVQAMGVKEFAAMVGMAPPNVMRASSPRHNPTQETLNRLLEPFRLKVGLARLDPPDRPAGQ